MGRVMPTQCASMRDFLFFLDQLGDAFAKWTFLLCWLHWHAWRLVRLVE